MAVRAHDNEILQSRGATTIAALRERGCVMNFREVPAELAVDVLEIEAADRAAHSAGPSAVRFLRAFTRARRTLTHDVHDELLAAFIELAFEEGQVVRVERIFPFDIVAVLGLGSRERAEADEVIFEHACA
jgi:hypothetical protein